MEVKKLVFVMSKHFNYTKIHREVSIRNEQTVTAISVVRPAGAPEEALLDAQLGLRGQRRVVAHLETSNRLVLL